MEPVTLKLPLWNGLPICLPYLGSQESKKTGGTWSGEKTPYPQILDPGRRTNMFSKPVREICDSQKLFN